MSDTRQLLMMGLPEAGKTTFLAALWHMVESNELRCSLRLDRMEGDLSFLNHVRERWMNAEPPARTDADVAQPVVLHLKPTSGGEAFALHIPDLAGETYRTQWYHRQRSKEQEARASAADGLLLLVSSRVVKPMLLRDIEPLLAATPSREPKDVRKNEGGREWDPERAPTQVMLVDLLQFVLAARTTPLRMAVLVTAWDLLPEPRPDPSAWLRDELPLLDQFLRANPERLEARIYGVSAQGGDYSKQEHKDRLTANLIHAERVMVAGPDCAAHDLTAPIRWLLG